MTDLPKKRRPRHLEHPPGQKPKAPSRKVVTSTTKVAGHTAKATKEHPEILVKSDKSGKKRHPQARLAPQILMPARRHLQGSPPMTRMRRALDIALTVLAIDAGASAVKSITRKLPRLVSRTASDPADAVRTPSAIAAGVDADRPSEIPLRGWKTDRRPRLPGYR